MASVQGIGVNKLSSNHNRAVRTVFDMKLQPLTG